MTEDERFDKLEGRVDKLEAEVHNREIDQLKQFRTLEQLIAKAVAEGNEKIYEKLEDLETRVVKLENQDGEKAKLVLKSIGTTTLGWIALGILNNMITIFNK